VCAGAAGRCDKVLDNRTIATKTGLFGLQRRLDDLRGQGRNHFHVTVQGKRLGYCYIRKNACSSFKKMFLDFSPAENQRIPNERPIDFMRRHHRMTDQDFGRCDHMILIYRDPVRRVMSMFRNKFIAQNGAIDIQRSFEKLEGCSAEQKSFRYFVESYLQRDFKQLDRHVLPQSVHLRPTVYTDVFPVEKLHEGMTQVLGADLADKYFQRPVNSTSDVQLSDLEGAADMPIADIRRIYAQEGYMPTTDSLLTADLKAKLIARYASDYDVIDRVKTNQSAS